jgi:AraC-like DNA-binding protein
MDPLAVLLDGPRARGAFVLRSIQVPPWSVRVQDQAPLSVVAIARGDPWVVPDRCEAARLHPGDVAIMRGPDMYTFADDPGTAVQVVIHPGARRTTPAGEELPDGNDLGVRTWGSSRNGSAVMLIGKYQERGEISQRLLRALPPVLVLHDHAQLSSALVRLLAEEIVKDDLAQTIVLDRLLDLLLVAVLRDWFARPEAAAPAWYRALGDPVVGVALRLMHQHPAHPWTVATLAGYTGMSRAALARRFTALVGEPPMTYLTGWRLDMAADLLREPDATLGAVAHRVGYGSAFALSTAFKRARGISPQEHRARCG